MVNGGEAPGSVVQTLLAAGVQVIETHRHPDGLQLECSASGLLGVTSRFLLVLSSRDDLSDEASSAFRDSAEDRGLELVLAAPIGRDDVLSFDSLLSEVGGIVPSWRTLSGDYFDSLIMAAGNELPPLAGEKEAWLAFERLVCDGLGFLLGTRTRHIGGARRGSAVPDVIARTSTNRLFVVDAKATSVADGFDAGLAKLRPLGDYAEEVRARQGAAGADVAAAIVVSRAFKQDSQSLSDVSARFHAAHGAPVAFMSADVLAELVRIIQEEFLIRGRIDWPSVFRGGVVSTQRLHEAVRTVHDNAPD